VKRRKGRRQLGNFENLPVTTHVYELSTVERACPCCGQERKAVGADESWQIEYLWSGFIYTTNDKLRDLHACQCHIFVRALSA
jgi:hypothetical protein